MTKKNSAIKKNNNEELTSTDYEKLVIGKTETTTPLPINSFNDFGTGYTGGGTGNTGEGGGSDNGGNTTPDTTSTDTTSTTTTGTTTTTGKGGGDPCRDLRNNLDGLMALLNTQQNSMRELRANLPSIQSAILADNSQISIDYADRENLNEEIAELNGLLNYYQDQSDKEVQQKHVLSDQLIELDAELSTLKEKSTYDKEQQTLYLSLAESEDEKIKYIKDQLDHTTDPEEQDKLVQQLNEATKARDYDYSQVNYYSDLANQDSDAINANESETNRIQSEITVIEENLSAIAAKADNTARQIDDLIANIAQINSDIDRLNTDIQNLNHQLEQVLGDIASLEQQIANTEDAISEATEKLLACQEANNQG